MKKTEFRKSIGISQSTLAKLSNNENVSLAIIVRICRKFNCTADEILEIVYISEDKTDTRAEL